MDQDRVDVVMNADEAKEIGVVHEVKPLTPDDIEAFNKMTVDAKSDQDVFHV